VSLELAWTQRRAGEIIKSWRDRHLNQAATRSVRLDFLFIVLYAAALALLGTLAGRAAGGDLFSGEHGETLGGLLAIAAAAAGVCDYIENAGLLRMLSGHLRQPIPFATSAISSLKWLLVAGSLLGSLGFLIASLAAAL
jgi:hypothetical protein